MFGQVWSSGNKFLINWGYFFRLTEYVGINWGSFFTLTEYVGINWGSVFTLTEYVGIRKVMVDQSVVDGNSLGDMFLHSGDQLTCHFFQLTFRQEAVKGEN